MKVSSERCLSLLGFSPETCVSTHQTLVSSVQVVVPTPDDQVHVLIVTMTTRYFEDQHTFVERVYFFAKFSLTCVYTSKPNLNIIFEPNSH